MAGIGLKETISSASAGSDKMLQGKKFPMNLTAFRLVVVGLLRGHFEEVGSEEMSANKWCLVFLLQGNLTMLNMDCVTLTPWRYFQMKHLNLSWKGNTSLVIKEGYGKGPGEIIGVTSQPRTLKVWAKIKWLLSDLEYLRNKDESPN